MKTVRFNLVVLRTENLRGMVDFYSSLGLSFTEEQHGAGPIHYSAQLGDAVLEIYPGTNGSAPDRKAGGSTMLGLGTDALDSLLKTLSAAGTTIVTPPKVSPWGLRAVVLDPDGRAIELTEAK